ncbi:TonB-dependent receptor [Aquabacterium sp. A7-Y]|uniref:TonB-dependent receptor n=1 Tax=Aquabacterium sp. A7-Y TaxID=1349605 RepID=UPI00223E82E3|nr:TonB-dependent receptor [Aquabacterium sp. A7-Y]MCW7536768.1 TonB-dependent receptor [Aquabacterium sp. A7-Y]
MSKNRFRFSALASGCLLACTTPCLHAQGVATDAELAPVVVKGTAVRSGLPAGLPGTTASKDAQQLREQNLVNPEDALQYAPNTTIRKRYPGDRNALIAGRSFGTLQPSRALVYVDGYLISNFLGRFDAPRWNMISPEAIERVDILYGPYSALFPGNSIGTTVAVTQRTPQAFEISGRVSGYRQSFDQYGHKDHYDGHQLSLHLGDRLASGLWYAADLNRQNSTSQPMQYHTVSADAAGRFPEVQVPGPATPVSGIVYDTDPKGLKRAVFGANSGAIDHTVQDTFNLRAGYRFTPDLEASAMAAWWHNDTKTRNVSFLRDASGAPVWSGVVSDGNNRFYIPASAFSPYTRKETHQQLGATLKTRHAQGWNTSLVVSDYRILRDTQRQADNPDPVAAGGGVGSITRRDGTGWNTAEVQATWTPSAGDWTGGRHSLAFGLHRNGYKLDQTVDSVAAPGNWKSDQGALSQFYRGKTEVVALYAQDTWRFADDWRLTLGWREERFKAFDGQQLGGGTTVTYHSRRLRGHSPKAALAFAATDSLLLKLSVGRGVRFPNVEELYNGSVTATSQTLSDPNLQAETSDAIELSAEQEWARQRLRVSLFHDDVKDAILRQSTSDPTVCKTQSTTASTYTCVQNVDRVKTSGIELAWSAEDLFVKRLGMEASAAYTFKSEVVANRKDPAMVGQWWLRVPRTRATLQVSWRPDDKWLLAAGYRHQGRAYNDTYNLDVNPGVYGGVSKVNQLDLRGTYKATRELELALGVNNVNDQHAYQSHPYPGRTFFAELRFAQ